MQVFVYGTLTDPDRVERVLDDWRFAGPATLVGLARATGRYPTLVPPGDAVGGEDAEADDGTSERSSGVDGRLLETPEVAALDAYEGVADGLYVRVAVPVAGREGDAAVYVGDPGRLGVEATWPCAGSFAERVRRYVDDHGVVVQVVG